MSRRPEGMPWSKFWWKDYDRDPALRRCSLEAEGLWMRLLCVMADAEPYGYLLVEGTVPDNGEIARMIGRGLTERRVAKLMGELHLRRVYSLDDQGTPFCRRMVREAKARSEAQINGAKGGNPALTKGGPKSEKPQNPPENAENIAGDSERAVNENNGLAHEGDNPPSNPLDKLQEERGEKQYSVELRSTAEPAPVGATANAIQRLDPPTQATNVEVLPPRDLFGSPATKRSTPAQAVYGEGLSKMGEMTGRKPDSFRPWIGKMMKDTGGNAALILEAVQDTHRRWLKSGNDERADPVAWVSGYVRARTRQMPKAELSIPELAGPDRWKVSDVVDHCYHLANADYDGLWQSSGFSLLIADALTAGKSPESEIYPVMRRLKDRADRVTLGEAWFRSAFGLKNPNLRVVA